jgi:HEAT repeat protein
MFSYRDLKAINLLDKLSKTRDSEEEAALLGALQDTPSKLAIKGLLVRIKSPRLSLRMESIRAIDALHTLTENVERALMDDIIYNPYTTAYRSAQTLGNHGVFSAIPLLRELIDSSDYMLAGEAIVALAKLEDTASWPHIEEIVIKTKNPRLKLMGVEAFGLFGFPKSLPTMLDILGGADPPPYLRDEVVLAMANILDIQNKFYPILTRFLADKSMAQTLALDEAEAAYEHFVSAHGRKRKKRDAAMIALENQAKALQPAVNDYVKKSNGSKLCRWILELPDELVHEFVQIVLSEAVLDNELKDQPRLQLLIVNWSAHELRLWTNKLSKNTKFQN